MKKQKNRKIKITRVKRYNSLGEQFDVLVESQKQLQVSVVEMKDYYDRLSDQYQQALDDFTGYKFITPFASATPLQGGDFLPIDTSKWFASLAEPIVVDTDWLFHDIPAYFATKNKHVEKLQLQLQELQDEFKERRCYSIFAKIRKIIQELKAIALRQLSRTGSYLRSLERVLLYGFRPNRIVFFRRLIQFLFKNMDDESGDASLAYCMQASNVNRIKHYSYDFQRKSVGWPDRGNQR